MKDHVIVCGAGSTGGYIVDELVAAMVQVVVIDVDDTELRDLAARLPPELLQVILGDATDEDVLARASLATARGIVTALANDKDNIYIIVETRQINPKARIIAKASEQSHVEKLRRVGADGVVTPARIGSLRMVSEMMRPTVVRFLDEMLRDKRSTYRIDEVTIEGGSEFDGLALRDAAIRDRFHMNVLAISSGIGQPWIYNPDPSEKLVAGMTLVVIGSIEEVATLRRAMVPT